jgi:hypothetical protein
MYILHEERELFHFVFLSILLCHLKRDKKEKERNIKMEHAVSKVPKLDAKVLAEVVEESHAWAVAHGLVMGVPGGSAPPPPPNLQSIIIADVGPFLPIEC